MLRHALAVARVFVAIFACRADLILENLALRQQVAVLQRKQPRPRLRAFDEVLKLGLEVSERTVSRTMPRRPAHPDERQRWRTFLANHREGIAAIDFFTVPTATFCVLYVFFVVHHARRVLVHFRATEHPTAAWITQQLREAFPYSQAPRYLILDRDAKYGHEVLTAIRHMSIEPKQITARSPWQNGVAERFVSTARRDLLDHVIVLNEKHLQRLLAGFASSYLNDRTHLSLEKDTPAVRVVEPKPHAAAEVIALPRLGGLHHRYAWRRAA
jgi:transposase InsO family protein